MLAVPACSGAPDDPVRDAGIARADAADPSADAGPTAPDAAVAPDAGEPDAAAAQPDAGEPADASLEPADAAVEAPDAAAEPPDASAPEPDASAPGPDAAMPVLTELTPAELHAALANKDFVMIDVHIPYAGVIPGTDASIAYNDVNAIAAYLGADLGRRVVLTCLGDPMSRSAGNALVARGYRAVSHLKGGMNAWVAAGYALQP